MLGPTWAERVFVIKYIIAQYKRVFRVFIKLLSRQHRSIIALAMVNSLLSKNSVTSVTSVERVLHKPARWSIGEFLCERFGR
jgi:hypothetical protein